MTISGHGFGSHAAGSGTSVTGRITTGKGKKATTTTVDGRIVSWADRKIVAVILVPPRIRSLSIQYSAVRRLMWPRPS